MISPLEPQSTVDLFLSYNSRDAAAVLRFRNLLKLHHLDTFLDRENLHPGLPWFDELEAALRKVRAVAVFFGPNGMGSIQKREMWVALDRQAQAEKVNLTIPVIPVILPGAKLEEAPSFLLLNTFIDLRDPAQEAASLSALLRAIRRESSSSSSTPSPICPYRGLRSFREEDSPLFFGRESFSRLLFDKVRATPFVAVVGASGSGKSSVVQAGLLPLLRRQRPPEPVWEILTFTPGAKPFQNLAAALVPASSSEAPLGTPADSARLDEIRQLATGLNDKSIPLDRAISQFLQRSPSAGRLLLIVDQFEELFTLSDAQERAAFIQCLLSSLSSSPLTLLITLRGDFFGEACALNRDLSDRIQQALVNIGPMTRDELRLAIEQPASYAGLSFEAGLPDRLIQGIEGQSGSLPLLEFALTELWERRNPAKLTHQAFDEIGGVDGALGLRAESCFSRLDPTQQHAALRLFSRLVRVSASPEAADTRQRLNLSEVDATTIGVAQLFIQARLLSAGHNEATGEETIEVAHEAILRRWERLKQSLLADREFLLWRQRLRFALEEWLRTGKDAGVLLRGAPLREALSWRKSRPAELNPLETDFLTASQQAASIPKRWLAAAVVFLILAAGGAFAYSQYTKTNSFIQSATLRSAPSLTASASPRSTRAWLRALVLSGHSGQALQEAAALPGDSAQALALAAIAESLHRTGQSEQAQIVLNQALNRKPNSRNTDAADTALWLSVSLARLGRGADALAILNRSQYADKQEMDVAEYDLANPYLASLQALAENGYLNEALTIALAFKDRFYQLDAFSAIIPSLVKAGRASEALAFNQLYTPSSVNEYVSYCRLHIYGFVASALMAHGSSAQANSVALEGYALAERDHEKDDSTWGTAFAYLAIALAETGNIDQAEKVIGYIALSKYIGRPTAAVAAALARSGKIPKALQKDPEDEPASPYRIQVWRAAAKQLGPQQLLKDAKSLTRSPAQFISLLSNGAIFFAETKQNGGTQQLLAKAALSLPELTEDEPRSRACGQIAAAYAKLGLLYQAFQLGGTCSQSDDKLLAYTAILTPASAAR